MAMENMEPIESVQSPCENCPRTALQKDLFKLAESGIEIEQFVSKAGLGLIALQGCAGPENDPDSGVLVCTNPTMEDVQAILDHTVKALDRIDMFSAEQQIQVY